MPPRSLFLQSGWSNFLLCWSRTCPVKEGCLPFRADARSTLDGAGEGASRRGIRVEEGKCVAAEASLSSASFCLPLGQWSDCGRSFIPALAQPRRKGGRLSLGEVTLASGTRLRRRRGGHAARGPEPGTGRNRGDDNRTSVRPHSAGCTSSPGAGWRQPAAPSNTDVVRIAHLARHRTRQRAEACEVAIRDRSNDLESHFSQESTIVSSLLYALPQGSWPSFPLF
jgi:hypothetical protein